jgi:hypothetical protein
MRYDDLPDALARQFAEACQTFAALRAADSARRQFQGSLRWKRVKQVDYLIKVRADGRQRSLGARSAETEQRYAAFVSGKAAASQRYRALADAMKRQRQVSRALRLGHVPATWIDILNGIGACGLADHVTVIGAAATYAYESAAGIRLRGDAGDALLSERRGRLQLAALTMEAGIALLGLLQQVDSSFLMCHDSRYLAVNNRGLEVELLFAAAHAELRGLLNGPRFVQAVLGTNGLMAMMAAPDPRLFALHKLRAAKQLHRDAQARAGDALLARVTLAIVRGRMQALPDAKAIAATLAPEEVAAL